MFAFLIWFGSPCSPTTATVTQTPSGTVTPTPAPSFRSIIDLPYGTSPGHTVRYMPKNVAGGGQVSEREAAQAQPPHVRPLLPQDN